MTMGGQEEYGTVHAVHVTVGRGPVEDKTEVWIVLSPLHTDTIY